jgi:hypothetical protein
VGVVAGEATIFESRMELSVSFAGIVVTVETEFRGRGREELVSRAAVCAMAVRAGLDGLVERRRASCLGKVMTFAAYLRLRSLQQGLLGRHVRIVARDALAFSHRLVDLSPPSPEIVFYGVALPALLRRIFDRHAALGSLSVADRALVFGQGTVEPGAKQRSRVRSVGQMAFDTGFDGNRQTAVNPPPLAIFREIMAVCASPPCPGDVVVEVRVVAAPATVVQGGVHRAPLIYDVVTLRARGSHLPFEQPRAEPAVGVVAKRALRQLILVAVFQYLRVAVGAQSRQIDTEQRPARRMRVVAIGTGVAFHHRRVEFVGGHVGGLFVAFVTQARQAVEEDLRIPREMRLVARHTPTLVKGWVDPFRDFTLPVASAAKFRRSGFQQLRVSGGVGLVAPVALGAATVEMPLVARSTRVIGVLGLHYVAGQTHARIPPVTQVRTQQVTIAAQ